MRVLLILAAAGLAALAQSPVVRLTNATRPGVQEFQIGDRFEIVVTGAADQPVSVRTMRMGQTDWGPVIGRTDGSGRWSTSGKFEKVDFGAWSQLWTVGGKLADPRLVVFVGAPRPKGAASLVSVSGPNISMTCETAEGRQVFSTPSAAEPFRTPDGRVIPGRLQADRTAEQYQAEIMESLIAGWESGRKVRQPGDEAGTLITRIIGPNALDGSETRNVLSIVRAAFEKPERIPEEAKAPSGTLLLLENLANSTVREDLKTEILETVAFVQAH
jgi:hypothetical protein